MNRVCLTAALAAAVFVAGCDSGFQQAGRVLEQDVVVRSEPTGSLLVHEVYELEPEAGGTIRFRRFVELDRADGVEFVSSDADGQPLTPGSGGLEVTQDHARVLDVRWVPSGTSDRPRRFALSLRALNAVAVTEPRAGLTWPLVTRRRTYGIDRLQAELILPAGSAIYPGTGVIETGWDVARTESGITAKRAPVGPGESATLVAAFDFDRTGVADPVWERNLDRQRQFLPALVAAAIFFFVIGAGTLIILRAQYPSKKTLAALSRPGPSDADRQAAARGLIVAGIAGAGAAAVSAAIASRTLWFLGVWVQIIPASMLIVAAVFIAYAPKLRR